MALSRGLEASSFQEGIPSGLHDFVVHKPGRVEDEAGSVPSPASFMTCFPTPVADGPDCP